AALQIVQGVAGVDAVVRVGEAARVGPAVAVGAAGTGANRAVAGGHAGVRFRSAAVADAGLSQGGAGRVLADVAIRAGGGAPRRPRADAQAGGIGEIPADGVAVTVGVRHAEAGAAVGPVAVDVHAEVVAGRAAVFRLPAGPA